MNVKLIIKNADGSPYWKENFDSQEKCDAWLDEEKTRPYWKSDHIIETEVTPDPPPPTEAELAAIEAEKVERDQNRQALKGLKKADLIDVDACAKAIMRIVKHLMADK